SPAGPTIFAAIKAPTALRGRAPRGTSATLMLPQVDRTWECTRIMAVETINPDLVTISLERVEGTPFERFVNAFYPAISGVEYVPLGGLHDGGADAMFAESIKEARGPQGAFLQASVQED